MNYIKKKNTRRNCIYHCFCLQICQKVTVVLWRIIKSGMNRKDLPQPAILFYNLYGELYNADWERGFIFSSTHPSHLFLSNSPVLHLHQSVEWFKRIKETRLALNKWFLICGSPFYFLQCQCHPLHGQHADSTPLTLCWWWHTGATQLSTAAQAGTLLRASAGCRLLSHSGTKIPVYLSHAKT